MVRESETFAEAVRTAVKNWESGQVEETIEETIVTKVAYYLETSGYETDALDDGDVYRMYDLLKVTEDTFENEEDSEMSCGILDPNFRTSENVEI